jgi:hypothetical protein
MMATTTISSIRVKPRAALRAGAELLGGQDCGRWAITILLRVKIRIMPPVSPAYTDGRFRGGDERPFGRQERRTAVQASNCSWLGSEPWIATRLPVNGATR